MAAADGALLARFVLTKQGVRVLRSFIKDGEAAFTNGQLFMALKRRGIVFQIGDRLDDGAAGLRLSWSERESRPTFTNFYLRRRRPKDFRINKNDFGCLLKVLSTYSDSEFLVYRRIIRLKVSIPRHTGRIAPVEKDGLVFISGLCKLRCFPPVALAWDAASGLYVFPNLQTESLVVDSSAVLYGSPESDKTTLLLLVDSHCSYKISISVSITGAASRFLLVYIPQMVGFSVAVVLFALMQQQHAQLKVLEGNFGFSFLHRFLNLCSSFISSKVMRVVRANLSVVLALVAVTLTTFVHPAFGLFILIVSHVLRCHRSLYNSLAPSFRNIGKRKEPADFESNGNCFNQHYSSRPGSPSKENSSSYTQAQEDRFNFQHGLLILHLLATLMFVPSLVSWFQRMGMHHSFPRFIDVSLCICLILHGLCSSTPWLELVSSPLHRSSYSHGPEHATLAEENISANSSTVIYPSCVVLL